VTQVAPRAKPRWRRSHSFTPPSSA
jgi:hypothetical protein